MIWIYILGILAIGLATLAMMINEGFWNNTITIFIIIFSGVLAFALQGKVASLVIEQLSDSTSKFWFHVISWLPFISLWAIYIVSFIILRLVTNRLSTVRVRFKKPVEWTGTIVTSILGGYLMMGIVGSIMHTSSLAEDFLGGALKAEDSADLDFKLTRPDIAWLRFYGALSTTIMPSDAGTEFAKKSGPLESAFALPMISEFAPSGETNTADMYARLFMIAHQQRRKLLSAIDSFDPQQNSQ